MIFMLYLTVQVIEVITPELLLCSVDDQMDSNSTSETGWQLHEIETSLISFLSGSHILTTIFHAIHSRRSTELLPSQIRPKAEMKLPFTSSKATQSNETVGSLPKQPGFWRLFDWKLMLALLFPVTLETLDYTVVATAQSHIASVFNALNLQSWIGTSYLLTSTVFLPFFAAVADVYGRHFGLQISLLFFLVGSALSTGAVNIIMVLAGRGIAGVGAAGLLTIVRTILSDTTSLNANNFQQSAMNLLSSFGFSVGPVTGGFLVTASFRWVFAINLPCTALAMVFCYLFLRNEVREENSPNELPQSGRSDTWISRLAYIDWIATFLFISSGILILLALNWGPSDNWKSVRTIVNLVIGAVLFVLCIVWEIILEKKQHSQAGVSRIFRARPMIPLEMFTSLDMCIVQYGAFVSGIVLFVMFYFVAIFMTVVTGLPFTLAGAQLLYFAPGLGVGSLISICLIKRLRQPIYPIVLGSAIMTVGLGLIQMAIQRNVQGEVDCFMALCGVGVGLTAGPLVIHARFIKPDHVAISNAMLLFYRAFGGTVGLAQCFTIMNSEVNSYILTAISNGTTSGADLAVLAGLYESGGLSSIQSLDGLPSEVQTVIKDAFRNGVRWSFVSLIPWAGLATLSSLFLSKIEDTDVNATGEVTQAGVVTQDKEKFPGLDGAEVDGSQERYEAATVL
ncbi:major facilitator superfamily domain-containing protein [Pisolithus marmoratus]|nr:major facilitator superfamily domain-containing protein [Pisolithus marmoratus]